MKFVALLFAVVAVEAAMPSPSRAADPRYPDWPCVQPKVPELSSASMWNGPAIDSVGDSWQDDPKTRELVAKLAARRTPLEEAKKDIAEFMTGDAAAKQDKAKKLFAGVFATLSQERSQVLDGIERAERNERDLADKIKTDVAALHDLEDKPQQDQTDVTKLADQVQWSTTIFDDRRKTIRYVCDVPNTIEQRLFAIARAIQQYLD